MLPTLFLKYVLEMNDLCKIKKLADRLARFSGQLERIKDLTVHRRIDHFYYMQKNAEFVALDEQLEEAQMRLLSLISIMEKEYVAVFHRWQEDIRWLQTYQMVKQH